MYTKTINPKQIIALHNSFLVNLKILKLTKKRQFIYLSFLFKQQVAVNEAITKKDFLNLIHKKYPATTADKLFCAAFTTKITFDVS